MVSVGVPVPDTEVRIASPDGARSRDGTVGEVRVRGPGVFSGYWNDDEATRETLHATAGCAPAISASCAPASSTCPAAPRTS